MRPSPSQSAELANDVYSLTKEVSIEKAIAFLNGIYEDKIVFAENNLIAGKTGGPAFIKVKTAFGFVLIGKKQYEGNVFVLFRGTQYLADWLTNLNITVSRTCSGQQVHDGFHAAFKSMKPQIQAAISSLDRSTHIHCIGHSLGGALATIAADWLRHEMGFKPQLYTFGSPRVGLQNFAEHCTKSVGHSSIYRVYHKTDIVPYIPVWPFVHTPYKQRDFYLPSPGIMPAAEWHSMDRYVDSVENQSWEKLYAKRKPQKSESQIEQWLKSSKAASATLDVLEWLGDAAFYVLKKCSKALGEISEFMVSSSFSALDKIAYILNKSLKIDEKISGLVVYLMNKISQFLGWASEITGKDLSRESIRRHFEALSQRANELTKTALSKALADGRAL